MCSFACFSLYYLHPPSLSHSLSLHAGIPSPLDQWHWLCFARLSSLAACTSCSRLILCYSVAHLLLFLAILLYSNELAHLMHIKVWQCLCQSEKIFIDVVISTCSIYTVRRNDRYCINTVKSQLTVIHVSFFRGNSEPVR